MLTSKQWFSRISTAFLEDLSVCLNRKIWAKFHIKLQKQHRIFCKLISDTEIVQPVIGSDFTWVRTLPQAPTFGGRWTNICRVQVHLPKKDPLSHLPFEVLWFFKFGEKTNRNGGFSSKHFKSLLSLHGSHNAEVFRTSREKSQYYTSWSSELLNDILQCFLTILKLPTKFSNFH